MAGNEPRIATGTTGTWAAMARCAAPRRNSPAQPSAERVPSGNISRLQPSNSRSSATEPPPPPRRSIGNVEKAMVEPTARGQVSKK
jgi:hypothetical protein